MRRIEIPRTFDLHGKRWRVRMVSLRTMKRHHDVTCDGLCWFDRRVIYINKEMPREQQEETWLHELEHAIEDARGIANAGAEHVVTARSKLRAQVYHTSRGAY